MTPLTALLCLGLTVATRTPVQAGTLPRPTLWAEPGSVIPEGSPVTFWCQGSPGTQEYILSGWGRIGTFQIKLLSSSGDKAKFHFNNTKRNFAAWYSCTQCILSGCSNNSNHLELIVTGAYSKPFLSALPSPVVTSGGTMTLQCHSWKRFNRFVLTQEGQPGPSQILDSQPHPNGTFHALFSVGPVSPGHSWIFHCYGHLNDPLLWSHPSNPLQLLVSEAAATRSTAQNKLGSRSDSPLTPAPPQDYTVENLGRMLIGAVVLLLLGILLLEAHFSQGRSQGPSGAHKGGQSLRRGSLETEWSQGVKE